MVTRGFVSFNFWANLFIASTFFVLALLFINRNKIKAVRYFLASRLRAKVIPKLKSILPIIISSMQSEDENLFPLFRLRADLEAYCLKSDVLFDEERLALTEFLEGLSSLLTSYKNNKETIQTELGEVILSGQRAIIELSELG